MRFLEMTSAGDCLISQKPFENILPAYAILSHTWGRDSDEVTLQDLWSGISASRNKPGYEKLMFCGHQAKRDHLQFFWVDTCCIDKTNSVELQEAILSMFRWYQKADKCYVYLTDVSCPQIDNSRAWEAEFRNSRWFKRGWTLQELLAPVSVEFFSREGTKLGNKSSLEHVIVQVTNIPARALRDPLMCNYGVPELLNWQEHRGTRRMEDKVYSLLGICDVQMTIRYGEGLVSALRRLRRKISKHEEARPRSETRLDDVSDRQNEPTQPLSRSTSPHMVLNVVDLDRHLNHRDVAACLGHIFRDHSVLQMKWHIAERRDRLQFYTPERKLTRTELKWLVDECDTRARGSDYARAACCHSVFPARGSDYARAAQWKTEWQQAATGHVICPLFSPGDEVWMRLRTSGSSEQKKMIVKSYYYNSDQASWEYKLISDPSNIELGPRVKEADLKSCRTAGSY